MTKYLLKTFSILVIASMLLSCAGWRGVSDPPPIDQPEEFQNQKIPGEFSDQIWWARFNDPHLERLIDEAFSENLTLAQFYERADRLRHSLRASSSGLFPSLSFSGSVQDNGDFKNDPLPAGTPQINLPTYDLGLSARYELDVWGKIYSGRKASVSDLLAGEENLRAYIISLSSQIARTYYQLVELKLQLELLENTVSVDEEYAKMTLRRYEKGVTNSLDVYQAQQILSQARNRLLQTEKAYKSSLHAFTIMIGNYPGQLDGFALADTFPQFDDQIPVGLPSELLLRRPDVRAAIHTMNAADRRWASAVASRFPSISLTGQISGSDDELADAIDPNGLVWTAFANLTAPLFQGGALKANADISESVYREQLLNFKITALNAFRDVENALVAIESNRAQVEEYEKLTSASSKSLEVATDRYLRGVSDYLRVINSQTAYLNAASGLLTARREYITAYIDLHTAIGGSWTEEVIADEFTTNNFTTD